VFAGISTISNGNSKQRIIPQAIKTLDLLTDQLSTYYLGEESTDLSLFTHLYLCIMRRALFAVNHPSVLGI
jgi:hypothetical protein